MRVAIIIPPSNFKDETLSEAELILRKKGVPFSIASFSPNECVGYHGAVRKAPVNADEIDSSEFDAILLIDGPGVDLYKLYDHRRLLDMIKLFHESSKIVASIGVATKIVARANIVRDAKLAATEDEETARLVTLYKGVLTDKDVVLDSNLLTASDSSNTVALVTKLAEALGAI